MRAQTRSNPEALVNAAVSQVGDIATLPEVTVKIMQVVDNRDACARDLHDVIKNDPALSARILKVVNSALYALPVKISSVDRAIVLLGLAAVKNISIAASMAHLFRSRVTVAGFSGLEVWEHSLAMAVASRLLATGQDRSVLEECFLAGLIADLGLLVERQVFPNKLGDAVAAFRSQGGQLCSWERGIIGADHQAFGAALARNWRFPETLCTAIGHHHRPHDATGEACGLATLVHIADVLACRCELGFCALPDEIDIDPGLLAALDLSVDTLTEVVNRLPAQVSLAREVFTV